MDNEVQAAFDSAKSAQARVIPELVLQIQERRRNVYHNCEDRQWSAKKEASELRALSDDLVALDELQKSTAE